MCAIVVKRGNKDGVLLSLFHHREKSTKKNRENFQEEGRGEDLRDYSKDIVAHMITRKWREGIRWRRGSRLTEGGKRLRTYYLLIYFGLATNALNVRNNNNNNNNSNIFSRPSGLVGNLAHLLLNSAEVVSSILTKVGFVFFLP